MIAAIVVSVLVTTVHGQAPVKFPAEGETPSWCANVAPVKSDTNWKYVDGYANGMESRESVLASARAVQDALDSNDPQLEEVCTTDFVKELAKYVKEKKADSVDAAHRLVTDPIGFHLVVAGAACHGAEHGGMQSLALLSKSTRPGSMSIGMKLPFAPHRGPLYAAAGEAYIAVREKRPNFEITQLRIPYDHFAVRLSPKIEQLYLGHSGGMATGRGTVASVKPSGKTVTVTFKSETVKVADLACKDSKKIQRIDWTTGQVFYEQDCRVTGWHNEQRKEAPIVIPAAHATEMKPGRHVVFVARGDTKKRVGVPAEVWSDSSEKKLVSYLGF